MLRDDLGTTVAEFHHRVLPLLFRYGSSGWTLNPYRVTSSSV
jgi:hypothetical protein